MLIRLGIIVLFLGIPVFVEAQISTDDISTPSDTIAMDTLRRRRSIVPNTRHIIKRNIWDHRSWSRFARFDIRNVIAWDEVQLADGYIQDAGQLGKSYEVFDKGFGERHLRRSSWRNVVMGRYNRYLMNPEEEVRYYDTKTPYVNVQFMQGARDLQLLDLTISQNVTPFWNATAWYERRQFVGAYSSNVTDHRLIQFNNYIHDYQNRYQLFINGCYGDLNDQLNGGLSVPDTSIGTDEFTKIRAYTNLTDAEYIRKQRSVYIDQYYHFGNYVDSIDHKHKISLRASALGELYSQRFFDDNSDSSLWSNTFPTWIVDSSRILDVFSLNRLKGLGGASYSWENSSLGIHVDGDLNYQLNSFSKDSVHVVDQHIFEQNLTVNAFLKYLQIENRLNIRRRSSNTFSSAETWVSNQSSLKLPILRPGLAEIDPATADTLRREFSKDSTTLTDIYPLSFRLGYLIHDQNPSLWQTFAEGGEGSNYISNPNLGNQQLSRVEAGIRWAGTVTAYKRERLRANYFFVGGFMSRMDGMIYYTRDFGVSQVSDGTPLLWRGIETGGRLRFLGKVYLESKLTFQEGTFESDTVDLKYYVDRIPNMFGKTSIFYENRNVRFASILRVSLDAHYRMGFKSYSLDPISGEFYPSGTFENIPYIRLDASVSTQIKRAFLFVKAVHVNEGLFVQGYYNASYYPALERTIILGVNWTFFD